MVKISIAIPSSVLEVEHGLLLKTLRIYQFIRFTSIFRVINIFLYRDPYTSREKHTRYSKLFLKIHKYLTTPPYLRKKVVPLDKDLRYVGILPPLRLKVFNVSRSGRIGEYRLGLMVDDKYVDIGLDREFTIVNVEECVIDEDNMVYVKIHSVEPPLVYCVKIKPYKGPRLAVVSSFNKLIDLSCKNGFYLIATSRYGYMPSIEDLVKLNEHGDIMVLFGSPRHGLYDIAREEGLDLEEIVDSIWNTIPGQMVKTVRTEEALIATLSILNMFINR